MPERDLWSLAMTLTRFRGPAIEDEYYLCAGCGEKFYYLLLDDLGLCKDCRPERENMKPPPRIIELCERLTSSGSIHGKLSASEFHEIADFIFELSEAAEPLKETEDYEPDNRSQH